MGEGIFGNGSRKSVVDVAAFFDSGIPAQVAGIMARGCLVSLGTTRDGGAISITVTHNSEWDREYFRDAGDALEWLQRTAEALERAGAVMRGTQGPEAQKPSRRRSRLS